jgi:tyrosyl-tRNA synthetase
MSKDERIDKILEYAQEVVTEGEFRSLFERSEHPSAYIGFEPSGFLHIGNFLITSRMVNLFIDAGFHVKILLADWHAFINDKFGGNIESIRACGRYMEDAFRFSSDRRQGLDFVYATDVIGSSAYWTELIKNAKSVTLSRLKRALTIMGRSEDEAEMDSSKMLYPLMQVTDIFMLGVDVAYAGMDQRKAHMLAREVAESRKLKKPVAVHTPILSSLKGVNRMDSALSKMSKSDPSGSIFLHDGEQEVHAKIKSAYCPVEEASNPILDICRFIIFPYSGSMHVGRQEKYGGNLDFTDYASLREAYLSGKLHPLDLKSATAAALWRIMEPFHRHYLENPSELETVRKLKITR